jgi:HEAT repeat protein
MLSALGLIGGAVWWLALKASVRRAANAVSKVREDLRSSDINKRHDAARAVMELGPLAKDAVPELTVALEMAAKDLGARRSDEAEFLIPRDVLPFSLALVAIGDAAQPTLLSILDRDNVIARLATIRAFEGDRRLTRIPFSDSVAMDVLRKGLRDKDSRVRYYACGALGDMKGAAKDAISDLLELKEQDPDGNVRSIAEVSAARIKENR